MGALFGFMDVMGRHMQAQNERDIEDQKKANAEMADHLDRLAKTAKPEYAPDYARAAMQIRLTPPGKKPPKEATDVYGLMLRQIKQGQGQQPQAQAQPQLQPQAQPQAQPVAQEPGNAFVDPASQPSFMPPPGAPGATTGGERTIPVSGAGMASLMPPPGATPTPVQPSHTMSSTAHLQSPPGYSAPPGMELTQINPWETMQMQAGLKSQLDQQNRQRLMSEAKQLFPNDIYAQANYINEKTVDRPTADTGNDWVPSGMPGVALNRKTSEFKQFQSDQPVIKDVAPAHSLVSIGKDGKPTSLYTAPGSDSNLSYQEQIHKDYQLAQQGDPAARARIEAHLARLKQEAVARGAPLEARRSMDIALLSRMLNPANAGMNMPPNLTQLLDDTARRVSSGELTLQQAQQVLGGQRSGLGGALLSRISETDSRILPAPVRAKITDVNIGMGELEVMEQLTEQVINSKDPADKLANTGLLEAYTKSLASRLSRANGEVGVLTDQDVNRAMTLVPGWKAANFAPEYARREIQLLRTNYERVKNAFTNQYFEQFSRTPGRVLPPPPGRGGPTPAPTPIPTPTPGPSPSVVKWGRDASGRPIPLQ